MSPTVRIDRQRALVVTRFEGAVDFDDVMSWLAALPDHPDFQSSDAVVVDMRAITLKQTRAEKAEELARFMVSSRLSTGRWAVLVTGPIATALTVLYQNIAATQHPIGVFSTLKAAGEFLGQDLSTDLP